MHKFAVHEFVGLPSRAALAAREERSAPAVYRGGAAAWPALSRWAGPAGADYLCAQHGASIVDVAVSGDRTFSGDVRRAQSVSVPFKAFLRGHVLSALSCGAHDEGGGDGGVGDASGGGLLRTGTEGEAELNHGGDADDADSDLVFYLAQCPLYASNTRANAGSVGAAAATENSSASQVPKAGKPAAAAAAAAAGGDEGRPEAEEKQERRGQQGGADETCSGEQTVTRTCLQELLRDICVPQALGGTCAALCSVNLWMCGDARGR